MTAGLGSVSESTPVELKRKEEKKRKYITYWKITKKYWKMMKKYKKYRKNVKNIEKYRKNIKKYIEKCKKV